MTEKGYISVADIMVRDLETIEGTASVQEAIAIMRQSRVTSLVVNRRDHSDEFGFIKIEDIARDVVGVGKSAERTSVYEVMVKPALTLPADMNIKYAVRLLNRVGLDRALVVDSERHPLGIATLRDIVYRYEG